MKDYYCGFRIPSREGAILKGERGHPIVKYTDTLRSSVQKQLARCKINFASKSCLLLRWQRYCTALRQVGVSQTLWCGTRNGITALLWIQDFLRNRKQSTGVNGEFSSGFEVLSGISQGSILEPLSLWLPCIADADIIFLPCGCLFLSFYRFFLPNLSGRRLDV